MIAKTKPKAAKTRGHGNKIDRLREPAIAALLTASTLDEAARKVGVATVTIKSWLADDSFKKDLDDARHRVFENAMGQIEALTSLAATTLEGVMKGRASAAAKVRAATATLAFAIQVLNIARMNQRLQDLENANRESEERRREEVADRVLDVRAIGLTAFNEADAGKNGQAPDDDRLGIMADVDVPPLFPLNGPA